MAFEDRIRLPSLNLIHRRPRLLNLLTEFVETGYRLITIYAPGGYGKSILLADFAQTTDLPVCWCSLEPADRDPTSFLTLLVHSITDRFHEIEPDSLLKLVQRGDTQASIHRIAELLSEVGPHLIIIDDYHKAVSAGMTLALNRLLEQLPSTGTIIIAARGDMTLETGQILDLLISKRATGLSEEELRFTGEELQRVMRKRFGRQIHLEVAEEIAQTTRGNIAQILMAGHTQSLQAGRLIGRLQQGLGNDQKIIYSYLAEEVFDKQPPELQRFLLYTSILPDMTVEICNELLDTTDAQAYIEELVKRDLFIAQIGAGFRYHDLFAEFLRDKLVETQETYRQVSLWAAQLLVGQTRFEEAINLYLSVQAWAQATEVLETNGKHFYDTGRALTLNNWLTQFPESVLTQYPRLMLLRGQILNSDLGELGLALDIFQKAEKEFSQRSDLVGAAEAHVWQSVSLRMMGRSIESLEAAKTGVDRLISLQAETPIVAWALRNRGIVHFIVGKMSEVLSDLYQALQMFQGMNDTYWAGMCHHDIGVCLVAQGNMSDADHHYRQAIRIWEALGNANDLANTLNSLGVSLYITGRYAEAHKQFQASLDIALQIGAVRRAAFALAGMGDTYLGRQDYHKAIESYASSTQFAREAGVKSLEVYNLVKTGECFYHQQDLIQALSLANEAHNMAAETNLIFEQGLVYALKAKIHIRRAEYTTSFKFFESASSCLIGDVLEQTKLKLWWSYSLLLDFQTVSAFKQLQEAIRLILDMAELRQGLTLTVAETYPLLLHFLYHHDTPIGMRDVIALLLKQTQHRIELSKPMLQIVAFGIPSLIVSGQRRQFNQRGGIHRMPEFLLYLLLEGREGGCRWSDVCAALWPDLDTERASRSFHQTLKRLRDTIFESPHYIVLRHDYYQINPDYLDWCDVWAFERLYERVSRAVPEEALALQLELIALYQGEFLAGFELEEWGEAYRISSETKFFQSIKLAGEQLLKQGSPQEALAVVGKGLAVDNLREELHRLALSAYAQLGLYDQLTNHYSGLCAILKKEVNAKPEPETQHLYQQLITLKEGALVPSI
jgi:ATP/maltotriose-dependent transcriptional regulator MalT/two-component SAPR family response regulator